jgi:hypothetical protein
VCGVAGHQAAVPSQTASAFYYIDRSTPLGDGAYLRIAVAGYDSANIYGEHEKRTSSPPLRQWTPIAVDLLAIGAKASTIKVELDTGAGSGPVTPLYVDDVRLR